MIISAIAPCNARSAPAPEGSIRLSIANGVPVVDGVFLNGQGPYRFVVDTGEQGNQVDASIARRLGFLPTYRVELASVTGTTIVSGGLVAEISLGSATAVNQEVLFTSLEGTNGLGGESTAS
jgi:Aspartyl protease